MSGEDIGSGVSSPSALDDASSAKSGWLVGAYRRWNNLDKGLLRCRFRNAKGALTDPTARIALIEPLEPSLQYHERRRCRILLRHLGLNDNIRNMIGLPFERSPGLSDALFALFPV